MGWTDHLIRTKRFVNRAIGKFGYQVLKRESLHKANANHLELQSQLLLADAKGHELSRRLSDAVEELKVLKPRLQNSEAETAAAKQEIQRLTDVLAQRQTEYATAEQRNQQLTGVLAQRDADRAATEKQLQRLTTF